LSNAYVPVTTDKKSWQQTKSENTRSVILDAAIQCFYDLGYNNTTTEKIAKEAGVSRGAMLYHFPSRQALMNAAVGHLSKKRLETEVPGVNGNEQLRLIEANMDVCWKQLQSPLFVVFHELQVASRTDPELRSVMAPAEKELEASWHRATKQAS